MAGIAGIALLCGLVPLLPVKQTTATILWPQAPAPTGTSATSPRRWCPAPRRHWTSRSRAGRSPRLPAAGGLVFSTMPAGGIDASRNGLFVTANADVVVVAFRDSVAAVAPRPAVPPGACSTLHVWANVGGVGADFVGIPGATGTLAAEKKPQVAGIFTDLKVAAQPGLSARIDVDTRFITSPTALKLGGDGARRALACWRRSWRWRVLDRTARVGAMPRRLATVSGGSGSSTWLADVGVVGTLLLWHLIGATSSDDGYNLTIARVSGDAGYAANYYRFFGATEAPFDWYQSVLGAPGVDQHRRRVDAAARHRWPAIAHLADHQPLRAAAARQAAGRQPGRRLDGGRGVPGGLAAVQQRPAARAADRVRRDRGLGAGRERHRAPAGCGRPRSRSSWRSSA